VGTASLAYENGFIYAHNYKAPTLFKLKASDGMNVWGPMPTNPNSACDGMSSPIVAGGVVVVGHSCGEIEIGGGDVATARGGAEAFDTETGMKKWIYWTVPETGENGAMVWSSVSIDPAAGVVYAATGNNYSVLGENSDAIHAIDMQTGMKKWKTQVHADDVWSLFVVPTGPDTDFGANPILATIGGKKVVGNGDKGSFFHMFDAVTGAVLWTRASLSTSRNQANGGILMNGAWDGKYFYAVSNQPPGAAVLHAMDPNKMGADVWPAKTFPKLTWGAPSLANGVLIVPSDDDLLVLNAATGEQLTMFKTGGTIAAGAAAIVDGNVVVGSGLMYDLDPTVKPNKQIICYSLP
jgi:polyvinyl alcohol dehydrogenase (cytochrome)